MNGTILCVFAGTSPGKPMMKFTWQVMPCFFSQPMPRAAVLHVADFAMRFNRALAEGVMDCLHDMKQIATRSKPGYWQAFSWFLERSRGYVQDPKEEDALEVNRQPEARMSRLQARLRGAVSSGDQTIPQ